MPTKSSSSAALARAPRSSRRFPGVPKIEPRMRPLRRVCIPASTFSPALMVSKSLIFWKVRPMPIWARRCALKPVTSRPPKTKLPAVGSKRPLTMLKNVVLPAPLGPIRLTIECSGMSKSTSLTATRPPKTLVIPRASRMLPFPFSSATGHSSERVARVAAFSTVQLLGPLAVGDDAFGAEEHHQNQYQAEQQEVVLRDVRLAESGATDGVADGVNPLVYLRQQVEVETLQDDRAQDHAVDVSHAAEDNHAQHEDRDVEREGVREDVLYERAVESARNSPENRPQGVGPELRRHRVYTHRRRCGLVLAHRDPGPTQPGIAQAYVDVDRDKDQEQYRVVPRLQIKRPEPLPRVEGVGQKLQTRRVYGLDADRPVGQVEAAEVVPVLKKLRDDLPEPQSDYSQVVPSQPQGRCPNDHTTQGGESPGEDQEY